MIIDANVIQNNWRNFEYINIECLIQKAGSREIYKIKTDKGYYILKFLDSSQKENMVKRDVGILSFLRKKGFCNIPIIVPNHEASLYKKIGNRFCYIYHFIDGVHPEESVKTLQSFASILAKLHNIPIDVCPYISSWDLKTEWNHLEDVSKKVSFGKEYWDIVQTLPDFSKLPKSIIHTDVHLNNAIQNIDGEIILIDWDGAGIGTSIFDLGFFVTQQFVSLDLKFNSGFMKEFFFTYQEKKKLSEKEKKYIVDAGLFYSLVHLIYGDVDINRGRIKFVLENRDFIKSFI